MGPGLPGPHVSGFGWEQLLCCQFRRQTASSSRPFTFLPPSPNTSPHKRGVFAFFLLLDAAASPLSRHPCNNLNRGQEGKCARGQRRPWIRRQGEGVHRHCYCCQRISSSGSSFSTLRTGMGWQRRPGTQGFVTSAPCFGGSATPPRCSATCSSGAIVST